MSTWSITSDELFQAFGTLVSCAAILLGARLALPETFRFRPPRRARRCPGGYRRLVVFPVRDPCWYDLSRVPRSSPGGIICPECGRHNPPRRTRRRRHYWRRSLLALPVLLMGYGLFTTPRVQSRGWPGAIPTTSLILAMPLLHRVLPMPAEWSTADPRVVAVYEEAAHRLRSADLWRWQRSLAVELVPVGERAWKRDPANPALLAFWPGVDLRMADPCLLALWEQLGTPLDRAQTRRLLARVLANRPEKRDGLAIARPAWWPGVPLLLEFRSLRSLLPESAALPIIRARVRGSGHAWKEYCDRFRGPGDSLADRDPLLETPTNYGPIEIEVEILLGARAEVDARGGLRVIDRTNEWIAWSGVTRVVAIEPDPARGLAPVDDPRDEQKLRSWLSGVRVARLAGGDLAIVWPDASSHFTTTGIDFAFAARFEIMREGAVIARGTTIRWLPEPGSFIMVNSIGSLADRATWLFGRDDRALESELSIRFTGDRRLAWRMLRYRDFWAGRIEVPLRQREFQIGDLFLSDPIPLDPWEMGRDQGP